jgi:superfamily II DNA/RNA helicase
VSPTTFHALDVRAASHHFWSLDPGERIECAAETVTACGPTVVFSRTRHGADRITRQLVKAGVAAVAIHGGRNQRQRDAALHAFTAGGAWALVATDVAARGIHVDGVSCVLHFDPPEDDKAYLRRSGRTARAGGTGVVVSFVTPDQSRQVARLQRQLGLPQTVTKPAPRSLPTVEVAPRRPAAGLNPHAVRDRGPGERPARVEQRRGRPTAGGSGRSAGRPPSTGGRGRRSRHR